MVPGLIIRLHLLVRVCPYWLVKFFSTRTVDKLTYTSVDFIEARVKKLSPAMGFGN